MTAPVVQIGSNSSTVELFWDADLTVNGGSFTLYYAVVKAGPYTAVATVGNVPNYGKRSIKYELKRADISFTLSNSFYVAGTFTPSGGAEGPKGASRFIPSPADQPANAGSVNSPLTVSERFPVAVGNTPVRVTFTADARQIEVFNYDRTYEIFVDVTGLDASATESMVVMPCAYYALGIQVSKDTGISMVSAGGPNDVRIVVHY